MPKLKTKKSLVKKVTVTKGKKVLMRHSRQNHFNAKQSGGFKRKKRRDVRMFKTDEMNVLKALHLK